MTENVPIQCNSFLSLYYGKKRDPAATTATGVGSLLALQDSHSTSTPIMLKQRMSTLITLCLYQDLAMTDRVGHPPSVLETAKV